MNGLVKKAGLGIALAATALTASAPADAQRYRHYRGGRGGDVAAGALLGGIVGLGLGAAIANNDRGRYYDRGYYYDAPPTVVYRERYYSPPPRVIYRDRYYPRGGYDRPRGYYGSPYGYGYGYGY
jgi:hypothetical protein